MKTAPILLFSVILFSFESCQKSIDSTTSDNLTQPISQSAPQNSISLINLEKGLVAYYPFNGNANDLSGKKYNGVVNGATLTTDRFGKTKSAYLFSYGNSINISTLHENNVLTYSISGWFQKNLNSPEGTIFCSDIPGYVPGGFRIFVGNGAGNNHFTFLSEFQNFACNGVISTNNSYADAVWHHFVANFSSAIGQINSNNFNIYIDGILISQTQYSQGDLSYVLAPINNGTTSTVIGSAQGPYFGQTDSFQGKLDDIRIYNRVLTQSEITYLATH